MGGLRYRDLLTEREASRARERVVRTIGLGGLLQGGQYAFRPSFPARVYGALGLPDAGWIALGAVLAACGLIVLTAGRAWLAHLVAAGVYGLLAVGQTATPPHGLPFLLVMVASVHLSSVLAAFDVRARLGIHGRLVQRIRARQHDRDEGA